MYVCIICISEPMKQSQRSFQPLIPLTRNQTPLSPPYRRTHLRHTLHDHSLTFFTTVRACSNVAGLTTSRCAQVTILVIVGARLPPFKNNVFHSVKVIGYTIVVLDSERSDRCIQRPGRVTLSIKKNAFK